MSINDGVNFINRIDITVSGMGLVVNGPAKALIYLLRQHGFDVRYEDWRGMEQYAQDGMKYLSKGDHPEKIVVKVNPLPWPC